MEPNENDRETPAWAESIYADSGEPDVDPPPTADRKEIADRLFLHALLARVHQPTTNIADRVSRAMRALGDAATAAPTTGAIKTSRRSWLVSGLALAAAISGVGVIWVMTGSGTPSAMAAVQGALATAELPEDRKYIVRTSFADGQEVQGMLYVRGAGRFALELPAPLGGTLWIGKNGTRDWIVPALGPVLAGEDPEFVQKFLNERGVHLPILEIATILRRMGERFDLTLEPVEGEAELEKVKGVRRGEVRMMPAAVEVWAGTRTRIVERIVLEWGNEGGVKRVEFLRQPTERLPDDWFDHAAHHRPGRPVIEN